MAERLAIKGGRKAVPDGTLSRWPPIDEVDRKMVLASLEKGVHTFGDNCKALQEEFAAWNGNRHAITTNSGTAALYMCLVACDCGAGDEVIVTAYSWSSSVTCAQRFSDPSAYDREMPQLIERIRRMGTQPAEVQVLSIDDRAYVGVPAEYFVQHGLRIKEEAHPRHALVVGHANSMVGCVPHKEAFLRGGYETTFAGTSRLAPEAGDILADCALELVAQGA